MSPDAEDQLCVTAELIKACLLLLPRWAFSFLDMRLSEAGFSQASQKFTFVRNPNIIRERKMLTTAPQSRLGIYTSPILRSAVCWGMWNERKKCVWWLVLAPERQVAEELGA